MLGRWKRNENEKYNQQELTLELAENMHDYHWLYIHFLCILYWFLKFLLMYDQLIVLVGREREVEAYLGP